MFTVLKLVLAPMGCCAVEFYTSGEKKKQFTKQCQNEGEEDVFKCFAHFAFQSVGCQFKTLHFIGCCASK